VKSKKTKKYGQELILDLYDCDPKVIRSKKKLQEFVDQLCRLIKIKKYGRTLIRHFGHNSPKVAGYSLVQLIETSSIVAHFSELYNAAYINVFSCKSFDVKKATLFIKKFFNAKKLKEKVIHR
jgi:S-adenosylmethionine/arginine decarboxylase-like enzyme